MIRAGAAEFAFNFASDKKDGAFTGEVSGPTISASGCSHVIAGHSERRQYFGETNESVLKKIEAALDAGLTPIVCVGEREKKNDESVLMDQFRCAISELSDWTVRKNPNRRRTDSGLSATARPPGRMSPRMLTG
jgi:triosephosphate isomerase